jgi:putative methyltransferase (TIGR04325 family)
MNKIKWFLKKITPPILADGYRWLRHKPNFREPLDGREVGRLECSDVFSSDAWVAHTLRKMEDRSENKKGFLTAHRFLIGTLINLLSYRSRVKVIDWGGGAGELYNSVISQVARPENVTYFVVDNERLIAHGREHLPQVNFVNAERIADVDVLRNADILFMSSVLQYVRNWQDFLRFLAELEPKMMIICRHISPDKLGPVLLAAQTVDTKTGFAGEILIQFIDWELVAQTMERYGYRLVSTLVSEQPRIFEDQRDQEYGMAERIIVFESLPMEKT